MAELKYGPLSPTVAANLIKQFGVAVVLIPVLMWYNYSNENLLSQLNAQKQELIQYKLNQANKELQNQLAFDKSQKEANDVFQKQIIDSIQAINNGNTKIDAQNNKENTYANTLVNELENSTSFEESVKYINKINALEYCFNHQFYSNVDCSN